MIYTLPSLPYSYGALEPAIDARTMEIHHTKHHQAYINNLNAALESFPHVAEIPLEQLLSDLTLVPEAVRTTVRNSGGGHANHSLFWTLLTPKQQLPHGDLERAILRSYESFDHFKEHFEAAAKSVFGSGWAWLVGDAAGNIQIITTANQDSPLSRGMKPILGLDVWEHAYYLQYQNRRPDYIGAWWQVVNWEEAEKLYRNL